ncbi:Tol-Pal system protein TolB [Candidatus Entotheonellaceae bacterium PAL068K]
MHRGHQSTAFGARQHLFAAVLVLSLVGLGWLMSGCRGYLPLPFSRPARPDTPIPMASAPSASSPINQPRQITSYPADAFAPALSPDGSRLLYASNRSGNLDIWLHDLKGSTPMPPVQLTRDSATDTSPAWSPDGQRIVFVSHRTDPQGDLFTLKLPRRATLPPRDVTRLTDLTTADSHPVWSPDGRFIVYTGRTGPRQPENLWRYESSTGLRQQLTQDGGTNAAFSPDGSYLVYAVPGHDQSHLWLMRWEDGARVQLTRGRLLDTFSAWDPQGRYLFFSRYAEDTNGDARISIDDNPGIWRLQVPTPGFASSPMSVPDALQLTSSQFYSLSPTLGASRVYFVSNRLGQIGLWSLPYEGEITRQDNARAQLRVATALQSSSADAPQHLQVLAFKRVLQHFPQADRTLQAQALYEVGVGYRRLRQLADATATFTDLQQRFRHARLYSGLAAVELVRVRTQTPGGGLHELSKQLEQLLVAYNDQPRVGAEALLAQGRIAEELHQPQQALLVYDRVVQQYASQAQQAAAALYRKATIYRLLHDTDRVLLTYLAVLEQFPEARTWAVKAANDAIDLLLGSLDGLPVLARLGQLTTTYRDLPVLPALAQRRLGDLHRQQAAPEHATSAYQQVIQEFPQETEQVIAARFALVEIAAAGGQYQKALHLYAEIMQTYTDRPATLHKARQHYLQLAGQKAQRERQQRDPRLALKTYLQLIDFAPDYMPAYRGAVKLYADLGEIDRAIQRFQTAVRDTPGLAAARYALGLAYTYTQPPRSAAAVGELRHAIRLDPQAVLSHQALGFVYEQMGRQGQDIPLLESALAAYQTALGLNDVRHDRDTTAHLLLNLGNVFFALENYPQASQYYRRRQEMRVAFPHPTTALLYHTHFGIAAYRGGEFHTSQQQFRQALPLAQEAEQSAMVAELWDRLGLSYQEDGKYAEAIDAFSTALALHRQQGHPRHVHLALRNLANNRLFLARARGEQLAPELLQQSLETYYASLESLGDYTPPEPSTDGQNGAALLSIETTLSLGSEDSQAAFGFDAEAEMKLIFTSIGRIYEAFGDYQQARRFFRQKFELLSTQVTEANTLPVLTEKALLLNQLGYLSYRLGDLPAALADLQASRQVCRELQNTACIIINQANIGRVVAELSSRESGDATDRQLQATLEAQQEALQLLNHNASLARGLYPFILRNTIGMLAYRLARRLPAAVMGHDTKDTVRQSLDLWQRSYDLAQTALSAYHQALHLLTDPPPAATTPPANPARLAAILLHNIGQVQRLLGQDDAAQNTWQRALTLAETFYLHDLQWKIRLTLAPFHPAGEPAILKAGIEALENSPAALALSPFDSTVGRLLERLYTRLIARLADQQEMATAYLYAERWQAQNRLLQLQAASLQGLAFARDMDRELSREVAQIIQQLRALQPQLATPEGVAAMLAWPQTPVAPQNHSGQAPLPLAPPVSNLARTYNRTLEAYHGLMQELRQERPGLGALFASDIVDAAEVRELLTPTSALVKYTLLPDRLLIWGIDQAQFMTRVLPLETAELTTQLNRLQRQSTVSRQALRFLSTLLVHPVAALLNAKQQLYILPDSRLLGIPWTALQWHDSPRRDNLQISLLHNGQHLLRAWEQRTLYRQRLLVLEAANTPQTVSQATWYQAARDTRMTLTLLPNTSAGRQQFLEQAAVHDIVHIHAPVALPGRAPVASTQPPDPPAASRLGLGLRTFYQMQTRAGLVVLSQVPRPVTDSARSWVEILNQSLLFAGFPTVLMHHGAADAEYDEAFFTVFYTALAQHPIGAALHQARLHMRRQQPHHDGWMRFQLYGYLGMHAAERRDFAQAHYHGVLGQAADALQGQNWDQAAADLEHAARLSTLLQAPQALPVIYQRLTSVYRHLQDYASAISAQQRLLTLLQPDGPTARVADAHRTLGILYSDAEQFPQAAEHLQRAITLLHKHGLSEPLQQSYITLGIAQERGAAYQEALSSFRQSLAISQALDKPEDVGQQLRRLGRIYLVRLNDYAAAREQFEGALDIFQQRQDRSQMVQVLLELGRVFQAWGSFDQALDYFQRATRMATDSQDQPGMAQAHIDQANTYWLRGDYQNAFRHQRQGANLAEASQAKHQQLQAMSTLGLIYWTLNNPKRARQLQGQALTVARQLGLKHEEASVYNNTGIIDRQQGRYDAALQAFEQALQIDVALQTRWGQAHDHRNLGMTYLRQGQLDLALQHLEQAIGLSRAIGDRVNTAKSLLSLADTQQQTGELLAAQNTYDAALALAQALDLPEVAWRALHGVGRLHRAQQRIAPALGAFRQAITVVEAIRAAIKVEEFRNGFLRDKLDLYQDMIFLLLRQGRASDAFNYVERARARSFIDLLGNRHLTLENAVSSDLLARHRSMQNTLLQLRQTLQHAPASQRPGLQDALARQKQAYQELLIEIKSAHPQLSTFVTVDPLTVTDLQRLLAPNVALVEYMVGQQSTAVWVITRDRVTVHQVPVTRQELSRRVQRYRQHLTRLLPVADQARQLYDLLLRPVAAAFAQAKYVGIVPHDILHYLPFAALHDGNQSVLDTHAVFYAPSASVLRFTFAKRRPGPKRTAVLAVGNPNLGSLNYDLPLAEKEVRSLRWPFPEITILTRDQALESTVVRNIDKYGIIHIASHGEFDSVNPLFSALKLAPDAQDDGNLEVSEIFGLNVQADLVTLSACQTGLGVILRGDEIIGLNRAFVYAGTHALIASLWRIDDLASAVLMKHFYRFYTELDKAESLRQAQLTVRQQFPHPSHWAGFVLSGDYF